MPISPARDLEIARQIQTSFLPQSLPQLPGWEIATRFQPAREVGGDFYDAFPMIQNRRLGLVVADVCDKGVAAALFMALCRSLIRACAQQHHSSNLIDMIGDDKPESGRDKADGLRRLRRTPPSIGANALKNAVMLTNNYIANNHGESNMFATLFFAVLDPATGAFNYINAGHNPPLIVGTDGVKTQLPQTGPAIGLLPDLEFGIQQARLDPHDTLLIYTDGITEARAPDHTFFSEERLFALLTQPTASATDLLARIESNVRLHIAKADQSDDITMLAVRRI